MANSTTMDRVGAALAALSAGETNLADLEASLRDALATGALSAEEARTALRHAIEAGEVPSATMARLGIEDPALPGASTSAIAAADSQKTRLRIAAQAAQAPQRDADETRYRAAPVTSAARNSAPGSADVADMVGQTLSGRYRLERELGAGGMGVVYLASDLEVTGETFAVKVLKPEISSQLEALGVLREEVRKTRALRHPNIVGAYSLNSDHECTYMLMEYLDGKPLDALIDEEFGRGMPFARAWPLIQDICAALAYAHDHSVIHCDLKPSNVFVTTSGHAKLLDFGIARAVRGRPGRFDPAALGALTPAYASCEMLEGREPDQSDDVYALGIVIYQMLSGKHPFGWHSSLEARNAGMPVASLAMLSSGQNAALAQALAHDRANRTASVEAVLAGLRTTALVARRRSVWLGVGACILAALAGVLWLAMKEVKSRAPATAAPAGSADRTTEAALERVRALVEEARSRGVDPNEQSMQQGMQQLRTAAQHLADGHPLDDKGLLPGVAKELESAIRSGRRVARLGSAPDEISLAMTLCQRMRGHCTAEDFADEAPRTASLPPFELDTLTVTNREFADFVAAERYITAAERAGGLYAAKGSTAVFQPRESWRTLRDSLASQVVDPSGLPVRGIDFKAANDYCHSHNKRLPTEDEWEFVARNTDHRIFAWGNEPRLPEAAAPHSLLPVRDQPMTGRFGARGLGDGVLEWVDGGTANERVLRGASWLDTSPVNQRLAGRRLLGPTHAFLDTGFRCARSVDAWPDRTNQRGT